LVSAGDSVEAKSARLRELVGTARERLKQPPFRNASVKAFLQLDHVQQVLRAGEKK
jgi:hypothetical protein